MQQKMDIFKRKKYNKINQEFQEKPQLKNNKLKAAKVEYFI